MPKKLTTPEVIKHFKAIHGVLYGYDEVVYTTSRTKVKIRCKYHGVFEQYCSSHLRGSGCKKCADAISAALRKDDLDSFLLKAHNVHGDMYVYDSVVYTGSKVKVKILCRKHGKFKQTPNSHIAGKGCKQCSDDRKQLAHKTLHC